MCQTSPILTITYHILHINYRLDSQHQSQYTAHPDPEISICHCFTVSMKKGSVIDEIVHIYYEAEESNSDICTQLSFSHL